MITEFLKHYGIPEKKDRILCAVSGGADSMCLLHAMIDAGYGVCAAHYNHGLRGAEADSDCEFVKRHCEKLNVPFVSEKGDVAFFARENGMSTEEAARILRYDFLQRAAENLGCKYVATAHNADDNAETMLLNLTRGSGLKGLCGIPPVRDNIIRPLIYASRSEIEAYLSGRGIEYVTDSTNLTDDYTRNIIRHQVMPVLKSINPGFSAGSMRTADSLKEDEACLDELADAIINDAYDGKSVEAAALTAAPKAAAMRVIRKLAGNISGTQANSIYELCSAAGLKYADITGMRVKLDRGRIYFGGTEKKLEEYAVYPGCDFIIQEAQLRIQAEIVDNCSKLLDSVNRFYFNYEDICGNIKLTLRRDGDKIRLRRRKCTKSLKSLFEERKMTQEERNLCPIIRDDKGILAVYGFGAAERCMPGPENKILRITITKIGAQGGQLSDDKQGY